MRLLFDTSAVAKLYHAEAGSSVTEGLLSANAGASLISRLAVIEMFSVLAGKLRTGEISQHALDAAQQRFRADLAAARFRVIAVRARHYTRAEALIRTHGPAGLRTLDALQLGVTIDLHENGLIDALVAADRVLCRIAPLVGLNVVNPEEEGASEPR